MDHDRGGDARDRHEQEHEQPVIRAAAFSDRDDRQERHAALRRHAGADHGSRDGRERVDEKAWKDAGEKAKRGKREHRGKREGVGFVRALCRLAARPAEEGNAEGLDEAAGFAEWLER